MKNYVKGVALATVVLLALETAAASSIRSRLVLAIVGVVIAALVVLRRKVVLFDARFRVPVAAAFVVSIAPALALYGFGGPDPIREALTSLIPVLTGWGVFLALLSIVDESETPAARDVSPNRLRWLLAVAAVFVLLATVHWLAVGKGAIVADEVVYLVQSRWIRPGQWTQSIESGIAPFFTIRQIDYIGGQLVGQYPAGWPMLLAAFRMLNLEWWSSVILGTASVSLTYLLAARLHSRRVGVIAALLLVTSQFFLLAHAGYMAHAAAIMSLVGAALCLLIGIERAGWRSAVWWAGAGALFGVAVATRPLTGLTAGASIGLWMLSRAWREDRRAPLRMAGAVALGGLLPAALFIAHNMSVTGGPFVLGYDAIHKGLYHLGFGTHGYMVLDADANRVPLTFPFTPKAAFQAVTERLTEVNTLLVPIGLLLPVIAAALAAGFRIRWRLVALFALLPLAHFFYRYSSLRLYTELLPFLFIGVALMLTALRSRWPSLSSSLLTMIVVCQVAIAIPAPENRLAARRPWLTLGYGSMAPARRMAFATADSLARVHGRILLFSREATRFDNLIDRLYLLNGASFDGPILVARDLGARNIELMRRYPDRVPFLVEDRHGDTPVLVTPIARTN